MATQLKPFLTDIANAIRTKKGTTAQINAQNFASEIASIETGGGLVGYSGTIKRNASIDICYVIYNDGTMTSLDLSSTTTASVQNAIGVLIYASGDGIETFSSGATLIVSFGYNNGKLIKFTSDNFSVVIEYF